MSEKQVFHNMTRPVKFRRLKLIKMTFLSRCRALRELTIYVFNYLLYKIHILKRYTYRDMQEEVLSVPNLATRYVETSDFKARVVMKVSLLRLFNADYLYREKNGTKKIVYDFRKNKYDGDSSEMFVTSTLEDISINIAGRTFNVDSLPVFKTAIIPTELNVRKEEYKVTMPEYNTVTFDIRKLKSLRLRNLIGKDMTLDDCSEEMLSYYYDVSFDQFEVYLRGLTLEDLRLR